MKPRSCAETAAALKTPKAKSNAPLRLYHLGFARNGRNCKTELPETGSSYSGFKLSYIFHSLSAVAR